MSITLLNAQIELSKQLADDWSSTTTSAGAAGGTTLIDTALMAKNNDFIDANAAEMYDMITSGTYDGQERRISSLSNTAGTLTVLAHGGQIATSVTYQIHRVISASDKRKALIYAARNGYPHIFKWVQDETKTAGDWLRNGDMEKWTVATYPDYWRVSAVTAAQNTTAPYYFSGLSSCKLNTAAGYLYTNDTLVPELRDLAGQTIKFVVRVWCDTASCLRLGVYDGTTTTYSSYHPGTSKWADDAGEYEDLELEVTLADAPSQISIRICHDVAAGTSYVDKARLIAGTRDKVYIGDLSLVQNKPTEVYTGREGRLHGDPWTLQRNTWVDTDNFLHIPDAIAGTRLRIRGIGYLDFLASGVSSTAWTATIDLDAPQLDILIAEAALYLFRQKVLPNWTTGDSTRWKEAVAYWLMELKDRRAKFGMNPPPVTISYTR